MGYPHDTDPSGSGKPALMTATDVTAVVAQAVFDELGVYLGAGIVRAVHATIEAVLSDHERLTEARLRARVVAAMRARGGS